MDINEIKDNYGNGWIKLFRSIRSHWIWDDPVKLKWWLDILLEVNHYGKKVNIGYKIFDCNRGESIMSLENWAKRWNVSKSVVNNFFRLLLNDNMIEIKNETVTTRLKVCNYDTYQYYQNALETQKNGTETQEIPKKTEQYTNKNEKKIKNEKNEKKTTDFSFVNEIYKESFIKWIIYKNERKDSYKGETSLKTCYNQLLKYSGGDPLKFEQIIEISISNNWKGLFELKTGLNGKSNSVFTPGKIHDQSDFTIKDEYSIN
jgi:hypothetical protein